MPEPITSQDTDIASLKSLISALANQCTTLSTRITTLAATASSSVRAGNRISALSALRSKKLAEKNLQQRSDTLHQLEEVFTRIEQAVDQIEIVKVMDASAGILRSLNKEIGGVENVENVVERLQEEMGKADEVGKVLEEPLNPGAVVDEGEIDEELEAMEEEDRREREEREAEATRKRLQELDKQDVDKKQTAGKQADVSANSQLEESTKRLSQMSIEDGKRHDRYDQEERQKITEET
jgi:charged multivesicular body protein 7